MPGTKRKFSSQDKPTTKKPKVEVPAYESAPSVKDADGEIIWPAPATDMQSAQAFIRECVAAKAPTLIVPDKDADGLSSGCILHRTLTTLGLPESLIKVHLLSKGTTVHDASERDAMAVLLNPNGEPGPEPESPPLPKPYIFILDHGSRASPPLVPTPHHALVIDHHHSTPSSFPSGARHINCSSYPPVATSSLLTYLLCAPLHPSIPRKTAWLAVLGTHGDLGPLKWTPPFPDLSEYLDAKAHTKSALNKAIPLLNAPRRTATYDVRSAWDTLLSATSPAPILSSARLDDARAEVGQEIQRWSRTPPKFSADAKIAVFRIHSASQIHPVIATRWAGTLKSAKLEIVLAANTGYLPGKVNFSCRIARCAANREEKVDIIATLKRVAAEGGKDLVERLGESFARGHKEASGGIVGTQEFEDLMALLRVGEKKENTANGDSTSPKKKTGKELGVGQKNTLANYFGKKT